MGPVVSKTVKATLPLGKTAREHGSRPSAPHCRHSAGASPHSWGLMSPLPPLLPCPKQPTGAGSTGTTNGSTSSPMPQGSVRSPLGPHALALSFTAPPLWPPLSCALARSSPLYLRDLPDFLLYWQHPFTPWGNPSLHWPTVPHIPLGLPATLAAPPVGWPLTVLVLST